MKYFHLTLSFLAFFLFNGEILAGPLNDFTPSLTNNSSCLEEKLKEILQLVNHNDNLQQNLRSETQLFFIQQKKILIQLKEEYNHILQYYIQKEGITEKINYKTQEIIYESTNPMEAIDKRSLQDIFYELNLNKDFLTETLNTISKNIRFATQNILPYTIEEFSTPLDFNLPTKQNNYYKLLMKSSTILSGNIYALIDVLADENRFAEVNPAHLTFYWNLLENLETLFGSYEKYLSIPVNDQSQQNPPLYVHIHNLR